MNENEVNNLAEFLNSNNYNNLLKSISEKTGVKISQSYDISGQKEALEYLKKANIIDCNKILSENYDGILNYCMEEIKKNENDISLLVSENKTLEYLLSESDGYIKTLFIEYICKYYIMKEYPNDYLDYFKKIEEETLSPIDTPHNISIEKITVSQEDYNKMKCGEYGFEQGNRMYMYFENNWLYIHYKVNGAGLYKAEIKENNGEYYIDEFFVEGNKNKIIKDFNYFENDIKNKHMFGYMLYKARQYFS